MNDNSPPGVGATPLMQFNNPVIVGGAFSAFAGANDARPAVMYPPGSLESIVAFDALLNSEERLPAPKCHPDTRKAALEIAEGWIWNKQGGFKEIMWISGAPGVGKSAILQTICERLAGAFNPIHASFFFTRGQGARELAASLPPTIAYQFTVTSIVCRWHIWYLLRNDPSILRESFHSQFRKLVITPAFARSYVQYPMIVVIDGLDECNSEEDRVALLKLILEATTTKSIRFLIASRPEEEIETFFKDPDVSCRVDHITLDEESFKTSKDIIIFLRSEFARIRRSRPHSIPAPIDGEEWPGNAIIARLAVYADGQFIYAILVIGFIDTKYFPPSEQLEVLLNPPPDIAPFSKLDQLYLQILTRCPPREPGNAKSVQYQETVKGVLRAMIAWPSQLLISGIASVLGEEVHAVQTIVRGPLRTLFKLDDSDPERIVFCHKSLRDSLLDPRRSRDFHVPKNALDLLYFDILSRALKTVSRSQLSAVLGTILKWTAEVEDATPCAIFSLDEVSIVSGVDRDIVDDILLHGPAALLFSKSDNGCRIFDDSFARFLSDADFSGEFHVPHNFLDLLYLRAISDTPPSNPPRPFSQEALLNVLHVLAIWNKIVPLPVHSKMPLGSRTMGERSHIAILADVGCNVVNDIVNHRPSALLFHFNGGYSWINGILVSIVCPAESLRGFLFDRDRSVEFCVPKNALDLCYLRILSSTPYVTPYTNFSSRQLLHFLYAIVVWPRTPPDPYIRQGMEGMAEVALRGIVPKRPTLSPRTISLIISSQSKLAYDVLLRQPISFLVSRNDDNVNLRTESFRDFLLDPSRSGEFHVPSNALDLLYLDLLSHPPPLPWQVVLVNVLRERAHSKGLIAHRSPLAEKQIAALVDECSQGVLFWQESGLIDLVDQSLRTFLLDPSRSGRFCMAGDLPDPSVLWPPL